MNLSAIALKNRTATLVLALVVAAGGLYAYTSLGRLEFPDFVIKIAVVATPYPGASAEQVEQEVTDVLEEAIQSLGELKRVTSLSQDGLSVIHAEMEDRYHSDELQQIWDKLRRKVGDIQGRLPPGAGPSVVNDDFGDVYGLFYAITGAEYSFRELKDYADELKKQLLLCDDVAKIAFWGIQQEVIYIEVPQTRLAKLGLSPQAILGVVQSQDVVQPSGQVMLGDDYVRIEPTGEFRCETQIGDLLITSPATGGAFRLRDIAEIRRGYQDPPGQVMRLDGRPAIGMGISTVAGGNAVTMANAVEARLAELEPFRPPGMKLNVIYNQGGRVDQSVNEFMLNLALSVVIVIGLLFVFMGLRSGLLIGVSLLLTIFGTFLYMWLSDIALHKISLGALMLALGMLVDNAIVVVEGVLIKIEKGMKREDAAAETVAQTQWPLLGATFIAALAFAAIGFAPGNVGEVCRSMFWVLGASLLISWLIAVTITPLLCVWILNPPAGAAADPYDRPLFRFYRKGLHGIIRAWPVTLAAVAASIVAAVIGFGFVPQFFFSESTQPLFTIRLFFPQGTHIAVTSENIRRVEEHLRDDEAVRRVATFVGQGALRFVLNYSPQDPNGSFGELIVIVDHPASVSRVMERAEVFLAEEFGHAEWMVKRWAEGRDVDYAIEARFRGPDGEVLRDLAEQAKAIMRREPTALVRDDWRNRVPLLRPEFVESAARKTGLSRNDVAQALQMHFNGQRVGVYREDNQLLPLILRSPEGTQNDYSTARQIHAWSALHKEAVPLDTVVSDWTQHVEWRDPIIRRRHREREITAQSNPRGEFASVLQDRIRPPIEQMELPPGYTIEWGGEYEGSSEAREPLLVMFPICLGGMFLILILLFNDVRQPIIIFLCLPLISVGVTAGLLLTGIPFGFMAILGYLGLSGMLIKNAIVLIEEIDLNEAKGLDPYNAVLDAGVSRLRPVTMASGTTVLGMTPLIWDPFYQAMAATVAGGLIGSTVLALLVVPLFYVLVFRIRPHKVQ